MQVQEVKREIPVKKTSASDSKNRKTGGQESFMDILKNTTGTAETQLQKAKKSRKAEQPENGGSAETAAQQMAAEELREQPEQEISDGLSDVKGQKEQADNITVCGPEDGIGATEEALQKAMYNGITAGSLMGAVPAENTVEAAVLPEMLPGSLNAEKVPQVPESTQAAGMGAGNQMKDMQQPDASQTGGTVPAVSGLGEQPQKVYPDSTDLTKIYGMEEAEQTSGKSAESHLSRTDAGSQQAEAEGSGPKDAQADSSLKGMAEVLKQSNRAAVPQTEDEKPQVNLEKLQKEVDDKSYLDTGQMAFTRLAGVYRADSTRGLSETQVPVLGQVQKGIEQAVVKGQQFFSIRLQPEGLGEVIVHMASVGGKIAMSIGVTSQETQKLLSSEMAQLKEVLQPFHAEVKEIYQSQNGGMDMMAYQQNFYQQQRQQLYERIHVPGKQKSSEDAEGLEEAVQQTGSIPPESVGSVWNAYV